MARDPRFDPQRLDVPAFAAAAGALSGETPLQAFGRLADSLMPTPGDMLPPPVRWSAHGSLRTVTGAAPQVWLQLLASASVTLQCQRCLQPVQEEIAIDRAFRFVATEDDAARLDEETDDDVLATSARFDLPGLLEDELILALPLVAMHGVCPQPLAMAQQEPGAEDAAAPHPFAALAALRPPPARD